MAVFMRVVSLHWITTTPAAFFRSTSDVEEAEEQSTSGVFAIQFLAAQVKDKGQRMMRVHIPKIL